MLLLKYAVQEGFDTFQSWSTHLMISWMILEIQSRQVERETFFQECTTIMRTSWNEISPTQFSIVRWQIFQVEMIIELIVLRFNNRYHSIFMTFINSGKGEKWVSEFRKHYNREIVSIVFDITAPFFMQHFSEGRTVSMFPGLIQHFYIDQRRGFFIPFFCRGLLSTDISIPG